MTKDGKAAKKRDFDHILGSPSSERCREKGITFRLGTSEDKEQVLKFLTDEFFGDEPVFRSMGMADPQTRMQKWMLSLVRSEIARACLKSPEGYSILALDADCNIVGVKLGYVTRITDKVGSRGYIPWMKHFYWMLPESVVNLNMINWHTQVELGYHPITALKALDAKSMFEGEVLGVSKKARGLGLGKELVRMSMEIAKEVGCEVYFACVSGIYSQKIYHNLDFIVMKELIYNEMRDRKGELLLKDTREHTKAQNVYFRF